jgi:hypothetical protein
MIKLVKGRPGKKRSSVRELRRHCFYLSNEKHRDHLGKTIYPSRNHGCKGNGVDSFCEAAIDSLKRYRKNRTGRRGKPSDRLFEEIIYSTPKNAFPSSTQREFIEEKIIDYFAADAAARTSWHFNPDDGRADLHLIVAAKTLTGSSSTLWQSHGGANGVHLLGAMDDLDNEIAEECGFVSARTTHNKRLKSLGIVTDDESLASRLINLQSETEDKISIQNLWDALNVLGLKIIKITKRSVSVIWPNRKATRRYNIRKLFEELNDSPGNIGSGGGGMATGKSTDSQPKKDLSNSQQAETQSDTVDSDLLKSAARSPSISTTPKRRKRTLPKSTDSPDDPV